MRIHGKEVGTASVDHSYKKLTYNEMEKKTRWELEKNEQRGGFARPLKEGASSREKVNVQEEDRTMKGVRSQKMDEGEGEGDPGCGEDITWVRGGQD